MAGLSMGGGQTFEIVLRNPNLFAYVGGFSGVPGGNGGPTIDPKIAFRGVLADAAAFNKRMKLVWIGTGTMEPERMMQGMKGFREAITKAGIKHVFFASQGTAHEWLTWTVRSVRTSGETKVWRGGTAAGTAATIPSSSTIARLRRAVCVWVSFIEPRSG